MMSANVSAGEALARVRRLCKHDSNVKRAHLGSSSSVGKQQVGACRTCHAMHAPSARLSAAHVASHSLVRPPRGATPVPVLFESCMICKCDVTPETVSAQVGCYGS